MKSNELAHSMKCIILAAGASRRLRPLTDSIPKCLLRVGGITIIERTLTSLYSAGIFDITIVTGYRERSLRDHIKRAFPGRSIRFIPNLIFQRTNNGYSLFLARDFFLNKTQRLTTEPIKKTQIPPQPLLLLDSDIVFSLALIPFLVAHRAGNKLAVRVKGPHDEEEMRVRVSRNSRIVEINKNLSLWDSYGESIGIAIFSPKTAKSFFSILSDRMKSKRGKREFYEAAFQQLINEGHLLKAIDVSSYPSIEIDTKKDLKRAEEMFSQSTNHF